MFDSIFTVVIPFNDSRYLIQLFIEESIQLNSITDILYLATLLTLNDQSILTFIRPIEKTNSLAQTV